LREPPKVAISAIEPKKQSPKNLNISKTYLE
jgi:hypothetical protein